MRSYQRSEEKRGTAGNGEEGVTGVSPTTIIDLHGIPFDV